MRRAQTQLHCVRSVSGITICRCDLPRCNNITRSLAYFLADIKLAKRNFAIPQKIVSLRSFRESTRNNSLLSRINADLYPRVLEEFKIERSNLEIVTIWDIFRWRENIVVGFNIRLMVYRWYIGWNCTRYETLVTAKYLAASPMNWSNLAPDNTLQIYKLKLGFKGNLRKDR